MDSLCCDSVLFHMFLWTTPPRVASTYYLREFVDGNVFIVYMCFCGMMVGHDGAPILNVADVASPSSSLSSGFGPLGGLQVLQARAVSARRRLERFLASVGGWHAHSSLSSLNIVAALYGWWVPSGREAGVERVVVISKGHMAPALYAWLVEDGILVEEELEGFMVPGGRLQSHPDSRGLGGFVPVSTGSLGQGLSVANGLALASRVDGVAREVAVLLGDGELDEGQVWEAAGTAVAQGLDNVVAVVDRNMVQLTGGTEAVKPKEPLGDRWRSFGWYTVEVPNDVVAVAVALESLSRVRGRPKALIVRS